MNILQKLLMLGSLLILSHASYASVIVLDFEDLADYPHSNNVMVESFYDGGQSSAGYSGTDFGVGFSDNALNICLNTPGTSCSNTSRGGLGDPDSQEGALFFLSGSETFMNVADGFDTGISFYYSAINQSGSMSVFDGLDGTGNLLATIDLALTSSNCDIEFNAGFCPFQEFGLAFEGTAKSVSFAGVANQIVFDDVTFGSVIPGVGTGISTSIPEPSSIAILALGLMGISSRRLRKTVK